MRLPLIGLTLGLAVALWLNRVLTHLLFGIGPTDPVTFTAVAVVLLAAALAACWLPARKAARVDPLVALRCE
jgi:putative ABC transport system permease protein